MCVCVCESLVCARTNRRHDEIEEVQNPLRVAPSIDGAYYRGQEHQVAHGQHQCAGGLLEFGDLRTTIQAVVAAQTCGVGVGYVRGYFRLSLSVIVFVTSVSTY